MEGLQSTQPKVTPCTQCTPVMKKQPRHSSTTSPFQTTTFTDTLLMTTTIASKCGLSLETTWVTQRWANQVFTFMMRSTHTCLAMKAFDHWDESFLSFRKKLAKSLINNPYYVHKMRETRRSRSGEQEDLGYEHHTARVFAKHWTGELWDTSSKTKYLQHHCKTPGCRNRVRTYCSCDRGRQMCKTCYIRHVQELARTG